MHVCPSREGKRLLATHVHDAVLRAVKILAAEQGTTNNALLHEAVGLLLTAHNKSVPAEIDAELAGQRRETISTTVNKLKATKAEVIRKNPKSSNAPSKQSKPDIGQDTDRLNGARHNIRRHDRGSQRGPVQALPGG